MKPLIVLGTRPEAIKLSPVILEMQRRGIEPIIIHTGQHREMADEVLHLFGIVPTEWWDIMKPGQDPTYIASAVIAKMVNCLAVHKPDVVVVQGDTTTAMTAALMAFYNGYEVAHVEAGLRTGNMHNPFPEEANRVIIDDLSSILLAPTQHASAALSGWRESDIYVTGNTGIDALRLALQMKPTVSFNKQAARTILVTTHRRENVGRLHPLLAVLNRFEGDAIIYYSVHPNPEIRKEITRHISNWRVVLLDPPLDYVSWAHLMNKADAILTDSGGIQEEAVSLGKPLYVLRDNTERLEAVMYGNAWMVDITNQDAISKALTNQRQGVQSDIFGDGHAAEKIVTILKERYGK
jgi:UDP-N-acetylglucosamine 2-epimerase (non-hydrolysing)